MTCLKKIIVSVAILVGVPASAIAQQFDVPVFNVPEDEELVDSSTFSIIAKANRSYVCGINPRNYEGSEPEISIEPTIVSPSGASVTGLIPASEADAIRYGNAIGLSFYEDEANVRNNMLFFTAPNGDDETGTYTLTIREDPEGSDVTRIRANCFETSIVCNFNTSANEFNFLEMTSVGTRVSTAKISTLDFNGELTTSETKIFPAGLRADVDIHSLVGASKFGSLFIQPERSIPLADGFANPKVSFYKNGVLTSSVPCNSDAGLDIRPR